jgi:hypothetical protein
MTPADIVRMMTLTASADDSHADHQSTSRRVRFNSELEQGPSGGTQTQAPAILKATSTTSSITPPSSTPAVSSVVERTVVERVPGGRQRPTRLAQATSQRAAAPAAAPRIHGEVVERAGRAPTEQQLETNMIQREVRVCA